MVLQLNVSVIMIEHGIVTGERIGANLTANRNVSCDRQYLECLRDFAAKRSKLGRRGA